MFKVLSRSVLVMFLFDLFVYLSFSAYWYNKFNMSQNISVFICLLIVITGMFSLFLKGNYKPKEFNVTLKNILLLFEGILISHVPFIILCFIFFPKIIFAKFIIVNIISIFLALQLYRIFFHYYLLKFKKAKKILIVGANNKAKIITEIIRNNKALQMEVVGIVKSAEIEKKISESFSNMMHYNLLTGDIVNMHRRITEEKNFSCENVPVYDDGQNLIEIIYETDANIIIFTYKSNLMGIIPNKMKMYLMSEFYEMSTGKFYIDEDGVNEFIYDIYKKYSNSVDEILKRRFDIIVASIIFLVTLPITSYIAIRVWLTDKHSPFFTQTRIGKEGNKFECYKLRTMYVNSYIPKNGKDVKYADSVKTDDRIIPFCRWVRKARFDELPQMINIIKGDMSLVGPRAEWSDEAKVFEQTVPFYKLRQMVVAGWTGWSHINMKPVFSVDEEKERLSYDLYYIKHKNVMWDIAILVKAIFLAIGGRHE